MWMLGFFPAMAWLLSVRRRECESAENCLHADAVKKYAEPVRLLVGPRAYKCALGRIQGPGCVAISPSVSDAICASFG
jgi:hypothetical protein